MKVYKLIGNDVKEVEIEDKFLCKKCKGEGHTSKFHKPSKGSGGYYSFITCSKCQGKGYKPGGYYKCI